MTSGSFSIGIDIGGTKIASAVFAADRTEVAQIVEPTPAGYSDLVTMCATMVSQLDGKAGGKASVGIGIPGRIYHRRDKVFATNIPGMHDKPLRSDLEKILERPVRLANDADCAALSEAVDGAGAEYATVCGLIMGTGVGGGLVMRGRIIEGPNGLAGEIGHLPLPFRENTDGPLVDCACGQKGCIDKSISGPALARFYESMTGKQADAVTIAGLAEKKDAEALKVLDRFYDIVAKAMVAVIHTFDPEVITVSGGLGDLSGMYDEVPKRWGRYVLGGNPDTKFVPAKHGSMSGLRGAAWVGWG